MGPNTNNSRPSRIRVTTSRARRVAPGAAVACGRGRQIADSSMPYSFSFCSIVL